LKIRFTDKYHNLENQLKDLTEEKEYNLLYMDHLNQNYDNPILRNKLVAINGKERDLRDQAKELIIKSRSKKQKRMTRIMYFCIFI
jgi:hypothetical protein